MAASGAGVILCVGGILEGVAYGPGVTSRLMVGSGFLIFSVIQLLLYNEFERAYLRLMERADVLEDDNRRLRGG